MSRLRVLMDEDERYTILRTLSEDTDYSLNEAILQRALAVVGHRVSQDKLRAHLAWLQEQGLIEAETVGSGMQVVTLTARGLDVAEKRATVPGVAKPLPGL